MIRHYTVPVFLAACLVLGGASAAGIIANLLLQIAAIPLISWALWQSLQTRPAPQARILLIMLALLVALMLLQLIPLPPALWTLLPGRSSVVEGYQLLGLPLPWLPLSLTPSDTLASLLWLLPAFGTFLAITILGAFRGRGIACAIIVVTLASIALGALQVIGGPGAAAYIYRITNFGQSVGFFANSNHNATLMLVCIPFLAGLQATLLKRAKSPRSASAIRVVVGAAYAILSVGLLINFSLAGLGLALPVALTSWVVFGRQRATIRRWLMGLTLVVSAAAVATIAIGPFGNNLFGQQTEHVDQSRQTSFAVTLRAAQEYFPVGSGVGSFQAVYRTQEPLASVTTTYMNHAHNDWLEILLETGLPGMALASMFLAWWAMRARTIWAADEPDHFAQAAVIATAAILLHSIVDYPLRTAALSAVFAACIALMSGVRPFTKPRRTESTARHLSL